MKRELRKQMMLFLLLAGIGFHLFPELVLTIVFYIKGSSLAEWIVLTGKVIGVLVGMVFMLLAMKTAFFTPGEKNKGLMLRFLVGMVNTVFVYLLSDFVFERMSVVFTTLFTWHLLAGLIPAVMLGVVLAVLQGTALYLWIMGTVPESQVSVSANSVKGLFKHPILLLEVIVLAVAVDYIPAVVSLLLQQLPSHIEINLSIRFMIYLLIALLQAGGLGLVFMLVYRAVIGKQSTEKTATVSSAAEVTEQEAVPAGQTKEAATEENVAAGDLPTDETAALPDRKAGRRLPLAAISVIGIAVIFLFRGFSYYGQSPISVITEEIQDMSASAVSKLAAWDMEGGQRDLKEAVLIWEAWASILGMDEARSLGQLRGENPSNAMVNYLYFVSESRIDELERYLRVNALDPEFGLALLDMYEKRGELSEQQEVLADELKYLCASTGTYRASALRPEDLAGYEERLEKKLREYSELKDQLEFLELVNNIGQNGELTMDHVWDLIRYAEAHPEDWMAQYQAAVSGSSLTFDNADHYDRTIQAAIRFEKLYSEQNKLDDEQLCNIQLQTAGWIMTCYGYQQALPYLEKAIELGGIDRVFSMAAQCYEELGRHDESYDLCVEMLEVDPNRLAARYYAATNALKAGRHDEALAHTVKLAELAKATVTGEDYGADVALYSVLQFITVNDNSRWTGYGYAFYRNMTDEQKALVGECSFLSDYLEAMNACFNGREAESLLLAEEAIDRVLEENSYLPQAWYLKGAIHYEAQEFEEAVEAYKTSLSIIPDSATTWFALANAYDGMENYELAYDACGRTMALLPEQDHGYDWYGVSVHCQNLMNGLQRKLTGGN